jgi:hypothetical protein
MYLRIPSESKGPSPRLAFSSFRPCMAAHAYTDSHVAVHKLYVTQEPSRGTPMTCPLPFWITHALPDVALGGTVRHPQSKAYEGDETPLLFVSIVIERTKRLTSVTQRNLKVKPVVATLCCRTTFASQYWTGNKQASAKGDDERWLCHLGSRALNRIGYSLRFKSGGCHMAENGQLTAYSAWV